MQRPGLFYGGSPRQTVLDDKYVLTGDDINQLSAMRAKYIEYQNRIQDFGSNLRKAIGVAGNHFEAYHTKGNREEQFSNLIIALEALYTPDERQELTYRIRQTCSVMIGQNAAERVEVFEFLRQMFDRRGKLFHGSYRIESNNQEEFVTNGELRQLAGIVRRSILSFLALQVQGENNLDNVRKELTHALLDEKAGDALREKANYKRLIGGK